ncbi:jg27966 [Pararge aegeria aegeria]|uniref:Jg27966 protein n=1 Tax=Pararge aegeria aegeria TaxID=348720 RepID=A0A8S4S2S3_9NEOP|nr:jg27966 [Pararge aegeria aegeria]
MNGFSWNQWKITSYQGSYPYVTVAVVTAGVLGGAYCTYQLYRYYEKPKLPSEWKEVGSLKELHVYPIKSVGPVILNSAECTLLGLKDGWLRDRVLMVVDDKNNFITGRVYPELLLVKPTIHDSFLTLKHNAMEIITIDLAKVVASQKTETARVWGVTVPVLDCGREASDWFCRLLNKPAIKFRLVIYASQKCRQLKNSSKHFRFTKDDTGAFPDEVSFSMMNEASVEDLNTRLQDKVTPRQFRANLFLAGAKPYEEDNWKFIKIRKNVFEIIKPCFRCVLTTISPENGVRHSEMEPLQTLKTYRQNADPAIRRSEGNAPCLGMQMALRSAPGGIISLNDPIYAA